MCSRAGLRTRATIVDHLRAHRGSHELFFAYSNTQSLCEHHHNATKQAEEARGYSAAVGADGMPIDPRHPFNAPRA
jgi:hypothetical protein